MTHELPETPQTFSDKVLVLLREKIINASLLPGERLVESDLARMLGTSRGPVRDALKQLAVEGLVNYQPNKGCTVARLSPRDAYEVFFLRGSLEKLALQKSGCHIDDAGIFLMETALEEMRALSGQDNLLAEVHADERFHRQIVLSSHMERLVWMWELLSPLNSAMFLAVREMNQRDPSYVKDLAGAHARILDAIRQGSLEATCQALDRHYTQTGERIYRMSLQNDSLL